MPSLVGLVAMQQGRLPLAAAPHAAAATPDQALTGSLELDQPFALSAHWSGRDRFEASCAATSCGKTRLVICGDWFLDPGLARQNPFLDRVEQLLVRYENRGLRFLEELNGWFFGVLVDNRARQVIIFNDRYGMGRIYYHAGRDAFHFSSRARPLLETIRESKKLDERGLAEWLSCGCVLDNRTLFPGIFLLPPGSAWTISGEGQVSKHRYFDASQWETQPTLPPEDYYNQLKEVFPRVLRRYVNGRDPVAMSLTGGLDGRLIMSWASPGPGELPCYTFNGPMRDCADVRIARKVATVCGQSHRTLPVEEDFFGAFPTMAEQTIQLTDGAMDVTGAAELYLNRRARAVAPVRLTGNYGSEILRGHVAFRPRVFAPEVLSRELLPQVQQATRTYAAEASCHRLSFIAFKQVPWHHYARFAIEQSQIRIRSPYLDNDLVALAFQAPPNGLSVEPSLRLIAEGNSALGAIPTDRGISWSGGRTSNGVRRSFTEFLVKAEYAYDYGMPHWLARVDRCFAPLHLERLFLGRQKFCHFRSWYRYQLADYIKSVLLDRRSTTRWYVNRGAVETALGEHLRGRRNYTIEIHKLLSLELIQRLLLENS